MNKTLAVAGTVALLVSAAVSLPSLTFAANKAATSSAATESDFRDLYKELVETNTTASSGSCTLAAERMANRLKAAGYPDEDFHPFAVPEHPKDGGLVFIAPGRDPKATERPAKESPMGTKAILLLAHIDVVEAKREDWTRDPFKLVEENGYFYARGAIDDKAEAAIWVDSLIRYKKEGFHPRRTLKLALTCGEEGGGPFNGAQWLSDHQRELIDAEFAVNEGAFGELDTQGNRVALEIQAGEKMSQNFQLEVTNSGGHSSRPLKNNAIYHLAGALKRIEPYEFPAQFTDGNRAYFAGMAKIEAAKGETEIANAMNALVKDPNDAAAIALVSSKDPTWNATLRTTCVATMLTGGHAPNALPQRADANINCRIFPGVPSETVRQKLEELVNDPEVKVTTLSHPERSSPPPPLTPAVMGPFNKLAAQFWPGLPVVPILQPGATDGRYLNAVGIPTYGIEPLFAGPDLGHIHGLNEYIGVQSLLQARDFLYQLVKVYADQK